MISFLPSRMLQSIKWGVQAKKSISTNNSILDIYGLKKNVLYIVPHADDELLSGFCFLQKMGSSVYIYYCGLTGSNDEERNKSIREKEIKSLCEKYGMNLIIPSDWKAELFNCILDLRIGTIILPSYIDWHEEHRLINEVLLSFENKLLDQIGIWWYSVTVPIVDDRAVILPVCKEEQHNKYTAFRKYYESQRHMPIRRFMLQEIVNAKSLDYYAGEVFIEISYHILQQAMRTLSQEDLNDLKTSINNIAFIRIRSQALYNCVFSH